MSHIIFVNLYDNESYYVYLWILRTMSHICGSLRQWVIIYLWILRTMSHTIFVEVITIMCRTIFVDIIRFTAALTFRQRASSM